ncbi:MAG: hypothetical protein M3083_04250 [Actinomycetota bacterium]|nr:hypothetical protein [Actinomycetota bacterium]
MTPDLAPQLPATFAATRESLRMLACYVISPARKARTGRIGLRPTGDGFGTPPFDDGSRVRVSGNRLVLDPGASIPVTTLSAAADFVGISLSPNPGLGTDLPAFAPGIELMVDADASWALGACYAFADHVLGLLAADEKAVTDPQLWPEHFDLAVQVDLGETITVNVGLSPGDQAFPDPYFYVGPHDTNHLTGTYWNAPFGAILPYDALISATSPQQRARRFITEGLDLLRASTGR